MRAWVLVLAVTAVVAGACALGFRPANAGTLHFWGTIVGINALVAIGGIVSSVRTKEWHFLLPRWGDITKGFFAAAILFGATFGLVKLLVAGTPREAWIERIYLQLGDPLKLREAYGKVAAVIVLGAAFEEVVWRGFVSTALEPVLGPRRAWIASAALYAVAHVPAGIVLGSPALPAAALGVGLAMGALTNACAGRIPPAIIAHALFDICAAMMFRLVGTSV